MYQFTLGFRDAVVLATKFAKHRAEFPLLSTEQEYAAAADTFLGAPAHPPTWECFRVNGDCVRYNDLTNEFGVLRAGLTNHHLLYRRPS
jgi:pyocin large subunit-like protein